MKRSLSFICVGLLGICSLFSLVAGGTKQPGDSSQLPPASTKKDVSFERDVKPLLDRSCVDCHGAQKPKAGWRCDTKEALLKSKKQFLKGGDSANSLLIYDISPVSDKAPWMPPRKKSNYPPLSREEIGIVRAWIDQGAK